MLSRTSKYCEYDRGCHTSHFMELNAYQTCLQSYLDGRDICSHQGEAGTRLPAAIVDMKGKLDLRNWEESAANEMGHCWMTDCDRLYEHLKPTSQHY